ncbi:MAG: transcription-repair coupling factor [Armatimonadetes bacterium]|nr:transcription-repair coupling factor [Armatimonadota bacterium]
MRISHWANFVGAHPALEQLHQDFKAGAFFPQVASEARPFLLAAQLASRESKSLIITSGYDKALQWQAKLMLCGIPELAIKILPSGQSALFEDSAPETSTLSDRIGALRFLTQPGFGIVIATPQSALERTLPRELLEEAFVEIRPGQTINEQKLVHMMQVLGFERAEPVRLPGQFSRRGGIIDVFPMGNSAPVRIELFGDEVESMRSFDPQLQRSIGPVPLLSLVPGRETLYTFPSAEEGHEEELAGARMQFAEMILGSIDVEAANLPDSAGEQLSELIRQDVSALEAGVFFDRLDLYRPYLHPDSNCAVDLLADDGLLILDEPLEIAAHATRAEEELSQALGSRIQRGEILGCNINDFMRPPERFAQSHNTLYLSNMGGVPDWMPKLPEIDIESISMEPYRGRAESLTQILKTWREHDYTVIIATDQPTRAKAVLSQIEIHPHEEAPSDGVGAGYYLCQGNLAGGFLLPAAKIALVTDQELFGVGRLKLPQRKFTEGSPVATVLDLKPGDYVVHINFGIGMFRGLETRVVDGIQKEYLFIQYGGPDKLFVPADQLDRIQKYLNPGDTEPRLNRLSGGEWQKAVGKAREEAREFARDLIRLYAERKQVQRTSFGPDSPWQAEMEATFPWVETPSQLKAIIETKQDLQADYPMDRLICGDVGFGKTEVAIRAAFKVAQAGKQVAILCPTTILSEQHYRSFAERLIAFPVRLDILNRFRSASEKREIIDKLEKGELDIILGTHSLLGSELKFKDLGLVIIDEEQKFGVKQKEALKALRVNVDVLAMSATPIPRTLNMALMDIRQMSLINDPPPGRLPIRTLVRSHQDDVIRDAILREMARGGQVYYVYNRVTGIYHIAEKLRKLLPTAKIAVGHGQMHEKELEPVMIAFIKGEIDILLSTTIVESGLDIPNANTLIVDNADKFGLAQLYQLRGRVGRSDRQAYAYLLYPSEKELGENAMARLQSLQEFSTLGSGYSLAFRDLQIRGAGDLLGAKQSGTMATVGYELFMQIIHEEVSFLKSHADGDRRDYKDPLEGLAPLPMMDLPVAAFIPDSYVIDQAQRLFYYKQMMSSRTLEALVECQQEIVDRYGKMPEEAERTISIMRLRIKCRELGVEKVEGAQGRLSVQFRDDAEVSSRVFSMMTKKNRECFVARDRFIWPYTGGPLGAVEVMLKTYETSVQEIEAQRSTFA